MAGWALVAGLLLSSIGLPPTRFASAQPNTVATVGTDRLTLRRGPGKEFPPFAKLQAGTKVEIEDIEGEWARVITPDGQRGYVHSNFLQIRGESAPEAGATAPEVVRPTPTATMRPPATATPRPPATATARPTERRRPATPTATPKKRNTPTPTGTPTERPQAAATDPAGPAGRSRQATAEVSALSARNAALEAELQTLRGTVTDLQAKSASAGTAPPGDQAAELARLTAIVEALTKQLEARDVSGAVAGTGSAAGSDVRQGLSGTTVGAGVLGVVVGWLLGTVLGRRSDRSKRNRIRF